MSAKHKKLCVGLWITLSIFLFLFLLSVDVSISAFTSLVYISVGIRNSAIGSKICEISAGIKTYRSEC